jgi:hypothetical protein
MYCERVKFLCWQQHQQQLCPGVVLAASAAGLYEPVLAADLQLLQLTPQAVKE